jgi:hypothetical protein
MRHKSDLFARQTIIWICIGIMLGLIAVYLPLKITLTAIAGIMLLKYLATRPVLVVLIIVALTSSIVFEESIPLIPIGVGSLHVSDVLLLFMLGTLGYRHITEKNFTFAKSPLNTPLLLFITVSLVSATISVANFGADFNDVARQFRVINYYFLFFLITNLITEKDQIKLLIKGLLAIGAVVAAAMVVQAIIGESVQLMPGRIESATTFGSQFEALRILPPGQTLVFVTFIMSICMITFTRDRQILFSGSFYLVLLLGAGVVLTYNRSYWVTAILGIMLLLLITATENKIRLAALLTVVLIFGGSTLALFGGTEGKIGATINAVTYRFTSIFAGKELRHSSPVDDRRIENEYAVEQIKKHPLLGIGLGNDYRPQIYGPEDTLNNYVHNAYLWLLTDMGIVGFLFYCWFYFRFLIRAARNWQRITDIFLQSAVVGFLISGVAMLLMALYIPVFMEWFSIVVIASMAGLTEVLIRNSELGVEDMDTVEWH